MNTITSLYDNNMSGLFINSAPKAPLHHTSDIQSKNNSTLIPDITSYPTHSIDQPSKITQNSDQGSSKDAEVDKTKTYSEILSGNDKGFTQAEIQLIEELKQIDTKVRQHEMAHIAAGGKYITSGANFTYQRGPNGKNYAVGGEVGIDTSPVSGDPEATIKKMRQVKSAALAPADPSAQDLKVAANAMSEVSKALSELIVSQAEDRATANEKKAFGPLKKAADSYEKASVLPEEETPSFQIAV
jgi:hypothetical protein